MLVIARRALAAGGAVRERARGSSLVRNSGFIMATTVVNSGFGFLFWTVAARAYSASLVGLAAAIVSAMTVTSLICGVGSDAIVIAFLPKRKAGAEWSLTLHAALTAGVTASLLGGVATIFVLPRVSDEFEPVAGPAGILFVLGTALWTASTVLDATFVAERAARFMLLRNAVLAGGKLALLIGAVLLARSSWLSIFAPWVAASLCSVGVAVLLLPRLRRGYAPAFGGLVSEIRELSSRFAGHHLIGLFGALPPLILPVLVAARLSSSANAYFYATWMVGGVFFVVSPAVAAALFAEGSHERLNLHEKIRTSARIIACLIIPLALVYVLCGRLVLGLFGDTYASKGWPVLLLLLASAAPDAVTNIYVVVMRVDGRLALAALLNAGIAVTTVVISWLLLPDIGIAAAAVAWLIAQTAGALAVTVHVFVARNRSNGPKPTLTQVDA